MTRTVGWVILAIVLMGAAALGLWYSSVHAPASVVDTQRTISGAHAASLSDGEESAVRAAVMGFGGALAQVSLTGSGAASEMEEFYGPFVAPALLREWESSPRLAPGRSASNPWALWHHDILRY